MTQKNHSLIDLFKPDGLFDDYLLLSAKDGVSFYLNEKDEFVYSPCPGCRTKDENEFVYQFDKFGFPHFRCTLCGTLFVTPRPTQEQLGIFYAEYEAPHAWTKLLVATNNDRKKIQLKPRVEALEAYLVKTANKRETFSDIGAGSGNYCHVVSEAGLFQKVIASDINDVCIETCRKGGLETLKGTVEDFSDDSLDGISINDLIEHLSSPIDFLQTCREKLRGHGVIQIATPNGLGFDFQLLKDKTANIIPPQHLQYFSPYSMKRILEDVGFKNIQISTPGVLDVSIIKKQIDQGKLDLSLSNDFLSFLFGIESHRFGHHDMDDFFQTFLQQSHLSSHMLVFASK